jgi:hypothetical protein
MAPKVLTKIDEELERIRRSRRWLSLEIGRDAGYLRDLGRGKSTTLRREDLEAIAQKLGKPLAYFLEDVIGESSSQFTIQMPTDPLVVARAELVADMVITRLVQRRGIADITHEVRGRIVAAAMDAFIEATRLKQSISDELLVPILVSLIQSLLP